MEHLASRRNLWYLISVIVILPGLVSLVVFGLNRGIDFTGGAIWDIEFQEAVTTEEVKAVMADDGYPEAQVQLAENSAGASERVAVIRVKELQQGSPVKGQIEAQMLSLIHI